MNSNIEGVESNGINTQSYSICFIFENRLKCFFNENNDSYLNLLWIKFFESISDEKVLFLSTISIIASGHISLIFFNMGVFNIRFPIPVTVNIRKCWFNLLPSLSLLLLILL